MVPLQSRSQTRRAKRFARFAAWLTRPESIEQCGIFVTIRQFPRRGLDLAEVDLEEAAAVDKEPEAGKAVVAAALKLQRLALRRLELPVISLHSRRSLRVSDSEEDRRLCPASTRSR